MRNILLANYRHNRTRRQGIITPFFFFFRWAFYYDLSEITRWKKSIELNRPRCHLPTRHEPSRNNGVWDFEPAYKQPARRRSFNEDDRWPEAAVGVGQYGQEQCMSGYNRADRTRFNANFLPFDISSYIRRSDNMEQWYSIGMVVEAVLRIVQAGNVR